ncbi:MAG: hypothetical protein ACW97X_11155 [Candidatus Hodarchaeales archaeon]
MDEKKYVKHAIILIIFTINMLLFTIPSQTEDFWQSNELGATILRGYKRLF